MKESNSDFWEIPYLPIDPADVGRQYEPIIRINSQSGKGGSAYVMEHNFGFDLPKLMHPEFGAVVQKETDRVGTEIAPERIYELFKEEYLNIDAPYRMLKHAFTESIDAEGHSHVTFWGTIQHTDTIFQVSGEGNGPIDAFFNAIKDEKMSHFTFLDYKSHAITDGSDSQGVAYILLQDQRDGRKYWGVGVSHNINLAPCAASSLPSTAPSGALSDGRSHAIPHAPARNCGKSGSLPRAGGDHPAAAPHTCSLSSAFPRRTCRRGKQITT